MADKTNSLYGQIAEIVRQETIFLRHYIGQVISQTDELNIGMVQVAIPNLDWMTADLAPWCYPRQLHSMSVPENGEWVEVYFLDGDRNKPVYVSICNEMKKDDNTYCIPEWYTGDVKKRIIYQSPTSKKGIVLDDTAGEMLIDTDNLILIEGSVEPFVLGTQINTYLTTLATTVNSLLASKLDGGGTAGTLTAPSGILSTKIKGQ